MIDALAWYAFKTLLWGALVRPPLADMYRAAAPAAAGALKLVPEAKVKPPLNCIGAVETMSEAGRRSQLKTVLNNWRDLLPPTATRSGFMYISLVGPVAEKVEV